MPEQTRLITGITRPVLATSKCRERESGYRVYVERVCKETRRDRERKEEKMDQDKERGGAVVRVRVPTARERGVWWSRRRVWRGLYRLIKQLSRVVGGDNNWL